MKPGEVIADARTIDMVINGIQSPRKKPAIPSSRYTIAASLGTEIPLPFVVCNRAFMESSWRETRHLTRPNAV